MFSQIPMPKYGYEAFNEGMAKSQDMFDAIARNKLTRAQAEKEAKQASLPFGGVSVPGPAGQIAGLEMIRSVYGEHSTQYKQAQQAFNLAQSSTGSRVNYQNALTNSLPLRYTTNEGKQIIEHSNLNQGYSPAGTRQGERIAPGSAPYHEPNKPNFETPHNVSQPDPILNNLPQNEEQIRPQNQEGEQSSPQQNQIPPTTNGGPSAADSYGLRQAKGDLPASVMQKNLFANNIEKTIKNVDLNALTQYNGPLGAAELKWEEARDPLAKKSEKYQKYLAAEKKWNFLASQVRQFYGESIQPTAMEKKIKELDPRGAWRSKTSGKTSFNAQADLLGQELQTYRDAATNASVYTGANPNAQKGNQQETAGVESTKKIGNDTFVKINGEWHHA